MSYKKTPSIKNQCNGNYPKSRDEIIRDAIKLDPPKYMMGTTAIHMLGDISSSIPDLFFAEKETDDSYIGSWVTGFGFFNVVFPKATSRELTEEERVKYNKTSIQIGSQPPIKLKV